MSRTQRDLLILDEGGEIRIGEGAPGLNYTGVRYGRHALKAGEDDTIALMGGYNEDKVQWYVGEDGRLRTGEGTDIVGTFERFIVNVDEEIILRVSREGVHSQLTIELDGITADTGIFKSANWNGTIDDSYNVTDPGTTGWALTKAGDAAYANKLYGKDVELTGTFQTGDGTRFTRLRDGSGSIGGVLELVGPGIGTVSIQVDDAVHSLDFLGAVTYYFDADALIAEDLSVGGELSIGGRTVSYGANDSGGTGYRLLRVTNA